MLYSVESLTRNGRRSYFEVFTSCLLLGDSSWARRARQAPTAASLVLHIQGGSQGGFKGDWEEEIGMGPSCHFFSPSETKYRVEAAASA